MKIFIWQYLDKVSNRYHSSGGLVIVAENIEAAKLLAHDYVVANTDEYDDNPDDSDFIVINRAPDSIMDVVGGEEKIFIFPNAGCC